MKALRITPLNIASALLAAGLIWRMLDSKLSLGTIGWFLLLLLVLVVADQFFRLMLRSLKRIWLVEGIFVLLVVVVIWVIRLW